MKIGIDARLYGVKHTGIGRYVKNLVLALGQIDKDNEYVVFGGEELKKDIKAFPNFQFVRLETPIYSFAEQLINPLAFSRENLDVLHVPHFNAPILYSGKLVLTIHDLIKHLSTGAQTTTLPLWQYQIKHTVYRLLTWFNCIRANQIVTPSNYWNGQLQKIYHLRPQKIHTTYEAVDKEITINHKSKPEEVLAKYNLEKPFVLYTGNLYPHKNVPFLINTIEKFNQTHEHQLTVGIVCARSIFESRLPQSSVAKALGYVPDDDLAILYSQALALVHPSLVEGFGLTGLEAMADNLLVISSNATSLPEVYKDAALYFDPKKSEELINCLEVAFKDHELVEELKRKGKALVKTYSWKKTAQQTLKVYEQA